MESVILSLGGNIGAREYYLQCSRVLISLRVGRIERFSAVREIPAWGFSGPPFLNQILKVGTELQPLPLLETLQRMEAELGRTRKTRCQNGIPLYQDRTIDLDILYYGDLKMNTERLTIPHPRLAEREFFREMLEEVML